MDRMTVVVVAAIAVLGVVYHWVKRQDRHDRADRQDQRDADDRKFHSDRMRLTCHQCGGLADPIPETGNRYGCRTCGHEFLASAHGL